MSDRTTSRTATERPPGVWDHDPDRTEEILVYDAELAEVTFLLPSGQAAALECLAHGRGLTVGQLIRGLIHDGLARGGVLPAAFGIDRAPPNPPAAGRT